jgi:hypothetical protein
MLLAIGYILKVLVVGLLALAGYAIHSVFSTDEKTLVSSSKDAQAFFKEISK